MTMSARNTPGPLRFAVIGVGMMGADHAERVERVANAKPVAHTPGRATQQSARFHGVEAFTDPLELIADSGARARLTFPQPC